MRLFEMVQPILGKHNYREACNGAGLDMASGQHEKLLWNYFLAGGVVGAGCVFTGCDLTPSRTEVLPVVCLLA